MVARLSVNITGDLVFNRRPFGNEALSFRTFSVGALYGAAWDKLEVLLQWVRETGITEHPQQQGSESK